MDLGEPSTWMYVANTAGDACPEGFGQEEAIKSIWLDPRYADSSSSPQATAGALTGPTIAEIDPKLVPRDGLTGHWTCASVDDLPRVVRRRALEELEALYLVHGDRNPPDAPARGRETLARLAEKRAPDVRSGAVHFTGDSYLDMGASHLLAAPEFTAAFWMRVDDFGDGFVLLEKSEWMRAGYYIKYHAPESRLYAEIFDGGDERRIVEFTGIEAGAWHHIALAADGETLTAYVDGVRKDSALTGQVLESRSPLLAGRGCKGIAVKDIRVYARALSASEVAELVDQGR